MTTDTPKPACKVHGMIATDAVCGHVIVGMKYCGFRGDCEHKSVAEMVARFVIGAAQKEAS